MSILKMFKENEVNQSTKENILTSYLDTKNNSLCKIIRQNLLNKYLLKFNILS